MGPGAYANPSHLGGVLEEGLAALNVGLDGLGAGVPAGRAHFAMDISELERLYWRHHKECACVSD